MYSKAVGLTNRVHACADHGATRPTGVAYGGVASVMLASWTTGFYL